MKQKIQPVFLDVFVDGPSGALPMAIVVNDQNTPRREPGVKVEQFVPGRFVPIGVEPENGNPVGCLRRNRVLHSSLDEMYAILARNDVDEPS